MSSYTSLGQEKYAQYDVIAQPLATDLNASQRDTEVIEAPSGHELAAEQPGKGKEVILTRHTEPFSFFCDACNQTRQTEVTTKLSASAWLLMIALVLVSLWPCAFVPCCTLALKDHKHRCSTCKKDIAIKEALT